MDEAARPGYGPGVPAEIPLPQGFVSVNGGTGTSILVIETTTPDLIEYSDVWIHSGRLRVTSLLSRR